MAQASSTHQQGRKVIEVVVRAQRHIVRHQIALAAVEAGVGRLLERWPVLVALTADPTRAKLYAHFGCRMQPEPILGLLEGRPGYLGWLTADTFIRRCAPAVAAVAA